VGETVAETLTEIEQTRAALEADIDALFERLPDRDVVVRQAKVYGGAAAGAAVLIAVLAARGKRAADVRAKREAARINAEELARAFSPRAPIEDDGGSSRLGAAAVIAAVIGAVVAYLASRRD
jgi:hypothetical protein